MMNEQTGGIAGQMRKILISFLVGTAFSAILLGSVIYWRFLGGLSAGSFFETKEQLISQILASESGVDPRRLPPGAERQLDEIRAAESARAGANPALASQSFWNEFKSARKNEIILAFADMNRTMRRQQLEEMTGGELLLELGQLPRVNARDDEWTGAHGKADHEQVRAQILQLAEEYAKNRASPAPIPAASSVPSAAAPQR